MVRGQMMLVMRKRMVILVVRRQMMLVMMKDRDVGDGLAQHHLEEVLGALTPGRHQYSLVLTNVHSCAY